MDDNDVYKPSEDAKELAAASMPAPGAPDLRRRQTFQQTSPPAPPLPLSSHEDEEDIDLTSSRKRTRDDSSDEDYLAPRKKSATISTNYSHGDHSSQSSGGQASESMASTCTSETTTTATVAADLTSSDSEESDNEEIVYPPLEKGARESPSPAQLDQLCDAAAAPPDDTATHRLPSSSLERPTEDAVTPQGSKSTPTATGTNPPSSQPAPW
ncbi:hypothetical protein MTO96_034284 [Rhipicephalus appendiculatus]